MAFGLPVYSYSLTLISWFETIMSLHTFIDKKKSYCLIHVFSGTAADYYVIRHFWERWCQAPGRWNGHRPFSSLFPSPVPRAVKKT